MRNRRSNCLQKTCDRRKHMHLHSEACKRVLVMVPLFFLLFSLIRISYP